MTDPNAGAGRKLAALARLVERIDKHAATMARMTGERDELIRELRAAGVPVSRITQVAGVSQGRVSQVAPPARSAPAPVSEAVVPHVPAGPLMSGVATRRAAPPRLARVTAFVDFDTMRVVDTQTRVSPLGGRTLSDVLATISPTVTRVMVTGDWAELVGRDGLTDAEGLRRWGYAGAPGWQAGAHYTDRGQLPIFRWTESAPGRSFERTVEVTGSGSWFGGESSADVCAAAWQTLAGELGTTFPGAVMMTTPSSTGRDLWLRSMGPRQEWPTLAAPVRELIRSTSGQGRTETIAHEGVAGLDGFTYLDGRLMYAALTHGMPVGEATHVEPTRAGGFPSESVQEAMRSRLNLRGRWRATVTVPEGWAHVGLIGRLSPGGHDYPRTPGTSWETWADAVELRLAVAQGWGVELHEGLTWAEGKPLTAWRDKLVSMWAERDEQLDLAAGGAPHVAAILRAERTALRAIVLHGIGGFAASGGLRETVHEDASTVPAGAAVHPMPDGRLRAVEAVQGNAWAESMAHPEWAATIWARARVALLDHALPDGRRGGALHVPFDSVLGFRTDAIYLAGPVPDWPDDGKPGRFRVKGRIDGPVRAPRTSADLIELRKESES